MNNSENNFNQDNGTTNIDLEKTIIMSPISNNVQEPVVTPVPEPIVEPVAAPVQEPVVTLVPEPVVEPVAAPVQEPIVEPVVEPQVEIPEPEITPEVSEVVEPTEEQSVEPEINPLLTSIDSYEIPTIDPTIPVVAPVESEVYHAQSNQQEKEATPDLLSSTTVQQEPIENTELQPIPIDNSVPTISIDQSSTQTPIKEYSEEDELLRAYVGKRYFEVGRHRFFNIWGFIFGGLYLIYRKMYILGILFLSAQLVLSKFLNEILVFIILGSIVGLFFNIMYTMKARSKIKSIQKKYRKSDLIYICNKKGGTSVGNAILVFIMYITVVCILTFVLGMNTLVGKVLESFKINFNFKITGTVTDEYKENVDYYVGKLKTFMNNTDPNPGEEVQISDKELLKVVMPKAKQDGDYIACTLDNRTQGWYNTVGYIFKEGSTDCKSYMENAEKFIGGDMFELPDSVLVIFNSKKELGPGTRIDYKDSSCMYNQEKEEFECRKK